MNRREPQRSMKRFVWPQYLVEPQHIEGYFDGKWAVSLLRRETNHRLLVELLDERV